MSNIKELLIVSEEDVNKARKQYNKSEDDLKKDVAILKEWLRQERHLPKDEDDGRIERIFIRNKCRIEQTKKKLDNCYSFKVIYADYFRYLDPTSPAIEAARKAMLCTPLPKLTDKQERIMIFKIIDSHNFNGFETLMYGLLLMELLTVYDYSVGDIFIIDWAESSLSAMKTINPQTVNMMNKIHQESISGRYVTIQFINVPSYIEIMLQIMKAVLKPKIFGKVVCHKGVEGIYEIIPKKFLPADYGGEEKSLAELHDAWGKELPYQKDILAGIAGRKSNENLRIKQMKENGLYGTEGTFRKLNLD